ncbi:anion permease [Escherichia coli]
MVPLLLPVGVILLIIAPWLSYVLYKPEITHSEEVATWAGDELKTMVWMYMQRVDTDLACIAQLRFVGIGSEVINATAVGLLAVSRARVDAPRAVERHYPL